MTHEPTLPQLSADELAVALASDDWLVRYGAIERYSKKKPSIDAVPILCLALSDSYHGTVKSAAKALGKLGPVAIDAMDDLLAAANKPDSRNVPQSYPMCVEAMAAIQSTHPALIPLIKQHSISYSNWVPISYSLRALKVIGTPEALALLREVAEFWEPKLNKMQKHVVDKLLSDI